MRGLVVAASVAACVAFGASAALGDEAPPTTTTVPSESTVRESPPTTSEFGTDTEIEIALDDDGNVVPAHGD